ncbi:hypothetical protein ITJ38_06835 [Agreia pratensis]|uniref:hypothetical protein n=1 Tax=Agreia pratensis TaxID=150121 RepID=UPI001889E00D|nr:hypothetical protein [Agreia pratensis]MBF4634116.1 hypothetical protein [Agreia pratensis]
MAASIRFDIDLTFELADGEDNAIEGSITASGSTIEILVSRPEAFVDRTRASLARIRDLAGGLARRGVTIRLSGPAGMVGELGAVKTSVAQRVASGSPHIRLGKTSVVASLMTRRTDAATRIAFPPSTLLPLLPTFDRRARFRPTTTHAAPGSGRPRLIFVIGSENWDGSPPREFELIDGVTVIGSGPSADLRLEGLDPVHATITHTDDDEYTLRLNSETEGDIPLLDRDSPRRPLARVLRTGARIELGAWRLGYFRAEFADHGRPFGGRMGGELSRQKPQPPRPGARHDGGAEQ